MRRLYFLVPEIETARKIVDEILLARIEERHMHILAKPDTPLEDLPEASFMQKTDFVPAIQRGLAVGGVFGTLAGLVAVAFVPAAAVIAGGAILGSFLGGAGLGAWISGMLGLSVGSTRLKQFEAALEKGEVLMMIDVPKARVDEITELVKKHHPEAEVGGTEPHIPAFP